MTVVTTKDLEDLKERLEGELYHDKVMKTLYATDASAYREMPLAVAMPKTEEDIITLIHFARDYKTAIIPRTAGTSLAGQVVGSGIIVDVSKYFTKILEVNKEEAWVRVQPGVVRDDLNHHLKPYGLYFGPETSTANRAMIGGMIGNNSCGSNSVVYGSTREHLLSVDMVMADGRPTTFAEMDAATFDRKCKDEAATSSIESNAYRQIRYLLEDEANRAEINDHYPKKSIPRRNTGYALDLLLDMVPFREGGSPFNFCKLIAGSEGTLGFITEAKLALQPLPPKEKALLCAHFDTVHDALKANLIALRYGPSACELMDHYILECTKENIEQRKNRFFVQGDPKAILAVELSRERPQELEKEMASMIKDMKESGLGYHFPVVKGEEIKKVWTLRKAGLGLLSNIPGDAKPVAVIEDTAVDVNDLPDYIAEFNEILKKHALYCVHYAHAGSGELHLRPIIDLKTQEGNQLFKTIADEIATLVKKYKGSLSGEHGDGRLRGAYIPYMIGEKNYALLKSLKESWDPDYIFNPGKIIDTPPMNTYLRYQAGQETKTFETLLNFDNVQGIQRAAELCNGSGDCRKTVLTGGTMCPSYMATRNEKDTTRARANILRETLTHSNKKNPFDSEEVKEVMDLCLSCKGCKSECPSNVDVGKMKAEFLHQYYKSNGIPLRTKLIANFTSLSAVASKAPWAYNFIFSNALTSGIAKKFSGFAKERSIPKLGKVTLRKWYQKNKATNFGISSKSNQGKVYLFCDEFTNYNDLSIGITTIKLLAQLGYEVIIPEHWESGRTYLSKGLLDGAKKMAEHNVALLQDLITESTPLVGIEPSAILTFRDEYPDLVPEELALQAKEVASNALLLEEFLMRETDKGKISGQQFTNRKKLIKLHGHCHQKALSSLTPTKRLLSLPKNYQVHLIPSGCCGMAGSFGYEKEHYELSMKVGELVLFPTVRKQSEEVLIAAPGTSCRHQIKDGTGREAQHPAEILWEALKINEA